jgi:hypothetical protein
MALFREAADRRAELGAATDKLKGSRKDSYRAKLGKADRPTGTRTTPSSRPLALQPGRGAGPAHAREALLALAGADAQDLDFDVDALREPRGQPAPLGGPLRRRSAQRRWTRWTNINTAARNKRTVLVEGKRDREGTPSSRTSKRSSRRLPLEKASGRGGPRAQALQSRRRGRDLPALRLGAPQHRAMVGMLTGGTGTRSSTKLWSTATSRAEPGGRAREALPQAHHGRLGEAAGRCARAPRRSSTSPRSSRSPGVADAGTSTRPGSAAQPALDDGAQHGQRGQPQERLTGGLRVVADQVMRVLDREMTKPEWEWVQSVWDSLEGLYPSSRRCTRRRRASSPGKVVATKVETPHGSTRRLLPRAVRPALSSTDGAKQARGHGRRLRPFGSAYQRPGRRARARQGARGELLPAGRSSTGASSPGTSPRCSTTSPSAATSSRRPASSWTPGCGRCSRSGSARSTPGNSSPGCSPSPLPGRTQFLPTSPRLSGSRVAAQSRGDAGPRPQPGRGPGRLLQPLRRSRRGGAQAAPARHAVYKTVAHWGDIRKFALENSPELRFRGERVGKKLLEQLGDMGGGKPKSALSAPSTRRPSSSWSGATS